MKFFPPKCSLGANFPAWVQSNQGRVAMHHPFSVLNLVYRVVFSRCKTKSNVHTLPSNAFHRLSLQAARSTIENHIRDRPPTEYSSTELLDEASKIRIRTRTGRQVVKDENSQKITEITTYNLTPVRSSELALDLAGKKLVSCFPSVYGW